MKKIKKKQFLLGFLIATFLLALVRLIFPGIATDHKSSAEITRPDKEAQNTSLSVSEVTPTSMSFRYDSCMSIPLPKGIEFFKHDGRPVKERIYSVPNFGNTFPDLNYVQLLAAQRWGVRPSDNTADMDKRKNRLVYVGSNPYFYVDRLRNSQPFLVPRASVLLQDIGRNFFDSLQHKGIPLHKVIVTSVMRSEYDMQKLRGHNSNASQNSCHRYGTTFDLCYNRYKTIEDPEGPNRRAVRNDTLKWVLAEVLDDLRQDNRCYIKYEVNQGCFHITVR